MIVSYVLFREAEPVAREPAFQWPDHSSRMQRWEQLVRKNNKLQAARMLMVDLICNQNARFLRGLVSETAHRETELGRASLRVRIPGGARWQSWSQAGWGQQRTNDPSSGGLLCPHDPCSMLSSDDASVRRLPRSDCLPTGRSPEN